MLILIIQLVALACLLLAAFGVSVRGVSLGWLGLFLWFLVALL